jgi:polyribonucleotide nucleotidyltransferase
MMKAVTASVEVDGKTISLETGRLAKQANGAVLVRCGDSMVLVTAVASKAPMPNADFFPLLVEYREKAYAAAKFPEDFSNARANPVIAKY